MRWRRLSMSSSNEARKDELDKMNKWKGASLIQGSQNTQETGKGKGKGKGKKARSKEPVPFVSPSTEALSVIAPYLDPNKHISEIPSRYDPKCPLEIELDVAIKKGDFELAEELSDKLESQRVAAGVILAVAAKRYETEVKKKRQDAEGEKEAGALLGFRFQVEVGEQGCNVA